MHHDSSTRVKKNIRRQRSSKARALLRPHAELYYRDSIDGRWQYVKGVVTDFKQVREAEKAWVQDWSHKFGTVLEIEPSEDVDDKRKKYRHLSSVLTPHQYIQKCKRRTRKVA